MLAAANYRWAACLDVCVRHQGLTTATGWICVGRAANERGKMRKMPVLELKHERSEVASISVNLKIQHLGLADGDENSACREYIYLHAHLVVKNN